MRPIILFCFIFLQFSSRSQTYFSPILGYEFANLRKKSVVENGNNFNIPPFSVISPTIGFKIGRPISKKIDLTALGYFSKKNMKINNQWFIPTTNQKYNQTHLRISLLYNTKSRFYAGIGGNVNFISNIRYYYLEVLRSQRFEPSKEFGGHLIFGRKFKEFNVEIYYYHFFQKSKWLDYIYSVSRRASALGILVSRDLIITKKGIKNYNSFILK
jgi:hypothetical protein